MHASMAKMEDKVKAAEAIKEELQKVKLEASTAQEKVTLHLCLIIHAQG